MRLSEWIVIYRRIAYVMHYNMFADQVVPIVALIINLNRIIHPNYIRHIIRGKPVFVFGGGPTLKKNLSIFIEKVYRYFRNGILIVCADSGIEVFKDYDIVPDIIISDLDGDIGSIVWATGRGSIIVLHGHGDNMREILRFSRYLKNVAVSTQVIPIYPIINYGGYTDGDRAAIISYEFGAKAIFLVGMDFHLAPDPYRKLKKSHPYIKKIKLMLGEAILRYAGDNSRYFLIDGQGSTLPFKKVSWNDVMKILSIG